MLATPMLLVFVLLSAVGYAPYVLWKPHHTHGDWICVVVFHVLLLLEVAAYTLCVLTDPGTTPIEWQRAVAADRRLAACHRLCPKTKQHRPLRSHYCSVTRRVVLNMDHFCPWVVNTVGFCAPAATTRAVAVARDRSD